MRSRIRLAAAALSVVPLAFAVAAATAAKNSKIKPLTATCKTNVTIEIPSNDTIVTPPVSAGTEAGSVTCKKLLGQGVQADTFSVSQSIGDTLGTLTWYFQTGSLSAKFDLTPGQGSIGGGFASGTYTGTYKITRGTGSFKAYSGTGTSNCATPDSLHTSCTITLKVKP